MRAVMLAWGLLTATPAAAETIHMSGTFPAKARELVGAERIAIDRFGGSEGGLLAAAIAGRLGEPDAGGQPRHRLVGGGFAADVVLGGSAEADVDHDDYDEERSRCAEKQGGKCVAHEKYRVRCTRRTIAVTAEVRGATPGTGRPAYAASKPRHDTTSWCEDGAEPGSADAAIEGMISSIAYEVRTDIAPHTARYGVRIREARGALPAPLAGRFKAAVKLTNHDERGACAAFEDLARDAPDHPSIAFNVALCTEAAGDYARAAELYRRAGLLTAKGGDDVGRAIERTRLLLTAREDLAAIGWQRPAATPF